MRYTIPCLFTLLLLTLPGLAQETLLGEVHTSTTGAGSGTTLQGYLVDGPRVALYLSWEGRGGDKRAGINLDAAQAAKLKEAVNQAVKSGKPGDYASLSSGGSTLVVQNQADDQMKITYLILKPPGTKGWNGWVVAQVNLDPEEQQSVLQLLDEMSRSLKS